MCKHVAASLYGVGARLDEKPELLFLLRGVEPAELISRVSAAEAVSQAQPADPSAVIPDSELADVFGIDLETKPVHTTATSVAPAAPRARKPARKMLAAKRKAAREKRKPRRTLPKRAQRA
jgi:uncharacterized Zn finger protein